MPSVRAVETFAAAGTSANVLADTLYSQIPDGAVVSLYAATSGTIGQMSASFQSSLGVVGTDMNVNVESASGIVRRPDDAVFLNEAAMGALVLTFTAAAAITVNWWLEITLA